MIIATTLPDKIYELFRIDMFIVAIFSEKSWNFMGKMKHAWKCPNPI